MMLPSRRRHRQGNGVLVLLIFMVIAWARFRDRRPDSPPPPPPSRVSTPVRNPIEDILKPAASAQYRDGVAAAILIDTSGSMLDKVKDSDGARQPKIEIAQRAALSLVDQFDKYAREHPEKPILLGIYEFSDRGGSPCRTVIELGKPDVDAARAAIMRMRADGDTPIGDAMIKAKLDVDATGLSKRHILVITDGENTKGYSPSDVTRVISKQADQDRASIYFVAFDVAETKFNAVRDSGALVLAASNETDLKGTLDYLLTGKILVEQPEHR
jgi:hypothetical protein